MLRNLTVNGLAVVSELDLELSEGLTVLTGETGAGKSILLDAIGLVLGDRADSDAVRAGSDRSEVVADFDIADRPEATSFLLEQALDADGECLIRRVVQAPEGQSGRSRAFVNGRAVPLTTLRELGELLVDIHGQHEHQSLVRRPEQLAILDHHAGNEGGIAEITAVFDRLAEARERLSAQRTAQADRDSRLDYLRFQLVELDALALTEDEVPELLARHQRLSNAGELVERVGGVLAAIESDDGLRDRLGGLLQQLNQATRSDPALESPSGLLQAAEVQIDETIATLRHYLDGLDLDPTALAEVDRRMAAVHELSRKHRVAAEALPEHHSVLRAELEALEQGEVTLAELESELKTLELRYDAAANTLHESRVTAAKALSSSITELMQELGMPGGRFVVRVEALPDDARRRRGRDEVSFDVAANPGNPPKPLTKVASGGELSRISLAIQVAAAADTQIPTLIYDEVDSGVGGAVAEIVGRRLSELGATRQVLVVTHLPQVAARGQQHLAVRKRQLDGNTSTSVEFLNEDARVAEIARMLGGVEVTEATVAHAEEMLASAAKAG
jgi:DNA repair protein RecN (Recombination protein N)